MYVRYHFGNISSEMKLCPKPKDSGPTKCEDMCKTDEDCLQYHSDSICCPGFCFEEYVDSVRAYNACLYPGLITLVKTPYLVSTFNTTPQLTCKHTLYIYSYIVKKISAMMYSRQFDNFNIYIDLFNTRDIGIPGNFRRFYGQLSISIIASFQLPNLWNLTNRREAIVIYRFQFSSVQITSFIK